MDFPGQLGQKHGSRFTCLDDPLPILPARKVSVGDWRDTLEGDWQQQMVDEMPQLSQSQVAQGLLQTIERFYWNLSIVVGSRRNGRKIPPNAPEPES